MTYDFILIAWWEAKSSVDGRTIVVRWHMTLILLCGEKQTLSYQLKSRDDRATSTMSYDDRMTVVWCRTIIDSVLRRRTVIGKVVRRRRTTIAQNIVRWASTSHDVVWRRTTWHDHFKISHMNENCRKFLNITKTDKTSWDWPPMTATSYAITLISPIVGGRKTS